MNVHVIMPPDYIGATETSFTIEAPTQVAEIALVWTRSQLETCAPNRWHPGDEIRTLTLGDVLIVGEQCHIVELIGFRAVSRAYCENWVRRTLVERLIELGEYDRIRAAHASVTVALRSK